MRIALAEKNLSWQPILVNLRAREQKRPEFLRLNPNGKVPVLRDGETLLYDSTVINEYLEDRYPEPSLTYPDPGRRATVRQWEDFGDNNFLAPAEGLLIHHRGRRQLEPERIEALRQKILESLEPVERALEGKAYLVDRFTYADIAFVPRIIILKDFGVKLPSPFSNIRAWIERLKNRPSIQNLEH